MTAYDIECYCGLTGVTISDESGELVVHANAQKEICDRLTQVMREVGVYATAAEFSRAWELAAPMARLRRERNERLSACDWTQAADSPLTAEQRAAWATYRQSLRDLPSVYGGEGPIPWPVAPA